jgi:omega-hydroxy-beta-dihydromenaquinone-9 sulfotransferase
MRKLCRLRGAPLDAADLLSSTLKHRSSFAHNYLAGITAGDWWRLLRENRFAVDAVYWHRAVFITLSSLMNSIHRSIEERKFSAAVAGIEVPPPLFILGHWRTGTTHLHNLLALDSDQFAFANTYQVVNPHTFLTTEAVNTKRFAWMVPDKRPMDNMALSFDAPQEDEFAPCLMSLRSLYLGISFPRRQGYYEKFLTFRGVPREDVEAWMNAFRWFLQKLTSKHGKPLVLKSPPHTARIRLLLEMFPEARFVHIHRHPFAVFQSFRHYFDTAAWYTYLQRPDLAVIDDQIIERYTALHDAFLEERSLIPEGRFHEIRFADLERDPMREVKQTYERLGLQGFERLAPKLEQHVAGLAGYRKNQFQPLDPESREKVSRAWRRSFEIWNYSISDEDIR